MRREEPHKGSGLGVLLSFGLLLAGWGSAFISLWISLDSQDGEWFQRSGSLLVFFSVLLEIRQVLVKEPLQSTRTSVEGKPILVHRTVGRADRWFHWLAWSGIVLGTGVWGYGDLLFG